MAAELMVIAKPGVTKSTKAALSMKACACFLVWPVRQRASSAANTAARNVSLNRFIRVLIGGLFENANGPTGSEFHPQCHLLTELSSESMSDSASVSLFRIAHTAACVPLLAGRLPGWEF